MKIKNRNVVFFILLISISLDSYCQQNKEENTAAFFKIEYPYIYIKPIVLELSRQEIVDYSFDFYSDERKTKPIDSLVLFDIIANLKNDTTFWDYNNVHKCFLVKQIPVNLTEVQFRLSHEYDTSSITRFVNLIKNSPYCNFGDNSKSIISSVSKPEYDKTKKFAVIQYNLFNCHGEGRILIKLFKLDGTEWKEIDTIQKKRKAMVF